MAVGSTPSMNCKSLLSLSASREWSNLRGCESEILCTSETTSRRPMTRSGGTSRDPVPGSQGPSVSLSPRRHAPHGAADCAPRGRRPLSAASVEGVHDTITALSAPRIESIHKLVNDPGRITRTWVNGLLADGLEDAVYVEITGLVSVLTVVDTFHAALGMPLRSLPASEPGEPTRPPTPHRS